MLPVHLIKCWQLRGLGLNLELRPAAGLSSLCFV